MNNLFNKNHMTHELQRPPVKECGEERSEAFLQESKSMAEKMDPYYGARTFSVIATVEAQAGRNPLASIEKAEAITLQIEEPRGRAEVLRELAMIKAKSGQGADATFDKAMVATREIPELFERACNFRDIAISAAQAGLFEKSLTVVEEIEKAYDEMHDDHFKRAEDDALIGIAIAFAHVGRFEEAKNTADEIREFSTAEAFREIASELAKRGQFDEAKEIAKDLYSEECALAFGYIAMAQAKVGKDPTESLKLAKIAAEEKRPEATRSESLHKVSIAQARSGKFEDAKTTAREIPYDLTRVLALCEIADAEALAGVDISQTLEDARKSAQKISKVYGYPIDRSRAFIEIAACEMKAGLDLKKSIEIAKKMATNANALSHIAMLEAQAGFDPAGTFEAAKTMARQEKEEGAETYRSKDLANIAATEAMVGRFDQAKETLSQIEDMDHRDQAAHHIAVALARASFPETTTIKD